MGSLTALPLDSIIVHNPGLGAFQPSHVALGEHGDQGVACGRRYYGEQAPYTGKENVCKVCLRVVAATITKKGQWFA
jgi:hypothetical protein